MIKYTNWWKYCIFLSSNYLSQFGFLSLDMSSIAWNGCFSFMKLLMRSLSRMVSPGVSVSWTGT